jgi:hypothetical protein
MACPDSKADYSSENVSPVLGFIVPLVGKSPTGTAARFPDCGNVLDVPYTGGNLASSCNPASKMSAAQRKYERYAKKSKRLKDFEATSPAHITYFNPDICWDENT